MVWSRASGTVRTTSSIYKKIQAGKYLEFQSNYKAPCHQDVKDKVKLSCILEMIRASQLTGRNSSSYQQYDNIRTIITLYSNVLESSSKVSELNVTLR